MSAVDSSWFAGDDASVVRLVDTGKINYLLALADAALNPAPTKFSESAEAVPVGSKDSRTYLSSSRGVFSTLQRETTDTALPLLPASHPNN